MATFFNEKHVVLQTRRLDSLLLNTLTKAPLPPRQIAYESDSLLTALHLVSRTDWLCVASQWHMEKLGQALDLASYPLPGSRRIARLHELAQELRSGYRA